MARNNRKKEQYETWNGFPVGGFETNVTKGSWQEQAIKSGRRFPIPLPPAERLQRPEADEAPAEPSQEAGPDLSEVKQLGVMAVEAQVEPVPAAA